MKICERYNCYLDIGLLKFYVVRHFLRGAKNILGGYDICFFITDSRKGCRNKAITNLEMCAQKYGHEI